MLMLDALVDFSVHNKSWIVLIHAIAGAIGVGTVFTLDILFFSFLRDKKVVASESNIAKLIGPIFMYALLTLYITGSFLFLSDIPKFIGSTKFLLKLLVVGVLTINGFLLHYKITPRLTSMRFDTRSSKKKRYFTRLTLAAGAISLPSWLLAYMLGTASHVSIPLWLAALLYGVIVVIGVAISQVVFQRYSKS
jgi:uncharacterized membrane-anchored protein YitT (DUF2179 family)